MKHSLFAFLLLLPITASCEQVISFTYLDARPGSVKVYTNQPIDFKCRHTIRSIAMNTTSMVEMLQQSTEQLRLCGVQSDTRIVVTRTERVDL